MAVPPTFYFFYQQRSKEDEWKLRLSTEREAVRLLKPSFSTILDLSSVPDDNDWTKVRYRGPYYADFDAGDDLDLVCEQFKTFLAKLSSELEFDISQARMYASGSKGFHIEIPAECFMPKVPATGSPWLAYVYRAVSEALFVDTLDLNVYTGKRGRQWRTTNVRRDNGCYKVPLTLEDALTMTPELYRELIQEPRAELPPSPPTMNPLFVMMFDRAREKVTTSMRGKKKRLEKANLILDPWRAAKKTPPTIEKLMAGEELSDKAGFQAIAMQLAVYAASVAMPLPEFIERCAGLIERHVSDGVRYNTATKRKEELARMWEYMTENSLYDFEVGPIVRLLKQGTDTSDLGVYDTEDRDERDSTASKPSTTSSAPAEADAGDRDEGDSDQPVIGLDAHKRLRRGFFMNSEGMFRRTADDVDSICRATLRNVDAFFDVEKGDFLGYEFDIFVGGKKRRRHMATADVFTSVANLRKFFAAHQISFQGSESDAAALMDIMADKAERGGRVYVYPREGLFLVNHPDKEKPTPVKVFLTKDHFISSIESTHEDYFQLKYRPLAVTSSYDIDIHWAPVLEESMKEALEDLFMINKPTVVADLVGWFAAAHFRSFYLRLFNQFPMLQAYGDAGSGKSQTIKLLAHMHWYNTERISMKSAMSFTPFALDAHASSSTSAPFIIDEYKPRELRAAKGKAEKLKDLFKASYIGGDVGERGTLNKGAENSLGLIKSRATAPLCFMGEAIEMETAIIERSVCVPFSKSSSHITERTAAFNRLQEDPTPISALGRLMLLMGFRINLEKMREEMKAIIKDIELRMPSANDDSRRRLAPRMIYNRAVVIHSLMNVKRVLQTVFGDHFDSRIEALINARSDETNSEDSQAIQLYSMSELSKVLSRIALMSRDRDAPHEMMNGRDYYIGDGWMELRVEKSYDKYRLYCVSVHDTPLFDNLDAFAHALNNYYPCVDKICAASDLREDGSSERVVRLDLRMLQKEGVQNFKG